jgi:hypothetical protein
VKTTVRNEEAISPRILAEERAKPEGSQINWNKNPGPKLPYCEAKSRPGESLKMLSVRCSEVCDLLAESKPY